MAFTLRPNEEQTADLQALMECLREPKQGQAVLRAISAYPALRENNEAQAARISDFRGLLIEWRSWRHEIGKIEADLDEARRQLAATETAMLELIE